MAQDEERAKFEKLWADAVGKDAPLTTDNIFKLYRAALSQAQATQAEQDRQLSESILHEHVLREAIKRISTNAANHSDGYHGFEDICVFARESLSTPAISGLIVCDDKPIYQLYFGMHGWIEVTKESYNASATEQRKRIVYEKSEL